MKRLPSYFSVTRRPVIGTTAKSLLLSLTLSGCATPALRAPCPVDLSLVRDLTLPERPTRQPVNGDLVSYAIEMQEKAAVDNARKAELRKQLAACQ